VLARLFPHLFQDLFPYGEIDDLIDGDRLGDQPRLSFQLQQVFNPLRVDSAVSPESIRLNADS